ncbi:hypothetical protein LF048_003277 [Vibrio cholerae]|uniref:hypothetical protein n=1 Tax=Vibrio mimicus TaxID=674 RepID=UPI00186581CC|nr:hypothetical protein [Vibrio mimicus]EIF8949607.1 hypothetical protein [Vibrio cholerae]EJL6694978.1 hypothetical protein [Vibrio cholerae]
MEFTYFPEAKAPQQRQLMVPDEVFEFEAFGNPEAIQPVFGGVRLERFGNRVYLRGTFRVINGGKWFFRIPKSCVPYPADTGLMQTERLLPAVGYDLYGQSQFVLEIEVRWSDKFCPVGASYGVTGENGTVAVNASYYIR